MLQLILVKLTGTSTISISVCDKRAKQTSLKQLQGWRNINTATTGSHFNPAEMEVLLNEVGNKA